MQSVPGMPGKQEKLTLRDVISTALNAGSAPDAKPQTAEEKNKCFQISVKLWSNKEIDLTVDQMAFIKEKVLAIYNPLVCGRVSEIFEQKSN